MRTRPTTDEGAAPLSRRAFLADATRWSAITASGWGGPALALDPPAPRGIGRERLVRILPFEGSPRPREGAYGKGLNGRRWHDLTRLGPDTLVTPTERFFIRTRCPSAIDVRAAVRVGGLVAEPAVLAPDGLAARAAPMGAHLLECSGNGGSFGLISAAEWSGVPLEDVLRDVPLRAEATRVRVRGFDEHAGAERGSGRPGASWILSFAQIRATGAFLATGMNGAALPRDHGFPARLIVPGWYGCTCVKWVEAIDLVDEEAAATDHMREYAGRTHQRGTPDRARDFRPPSIDLAAMPVRVEQWEVGGSVRYRVVGVVWGGDRTTDALKIRFGRASRAVPVETLDHRTNRTWSLWSHSWRPARPGRYDIALEVDDATIRTRRLDRGFYRRAVRIREV